MQPADERAGRHAAAVFVVLTKFSSSSARCIKVDELAHSGAWAKVHTIQ